MNTARNDTKQSAEALIAQIERAFASVRYPGDDALTDSRYGEEPEALRVEFRGKRDWRELDARFLNQAPDGWGSALSFFSGAALQFYLPAYLIADVRGVLECGDPASRLCAFLTPQMRDKRIAKVFGGDTLGAVARRDFERFDRHQVSAIVAWLWWKLQRDGYDPGVEQGLEHWWLEREAQLHSASPEGL